MSSWSGLHRRRIWGGILQCYGGNQLFDLFTWFSFLKRNPKVEGYSLDIKAEGRVEGGVKARGEGMVRET